MPTNAALDIALAAVDALLAAGALFVTLGPWLGMGVLDLAPLAVLPVAALHVLGVALALRFGRRRLLRALGPLAVAWSLAAGAGWKMSPASLRAQVAEAEQMISQKMQCYATSADYYPPGALIHCQATPDSPWASYWVTNRPLGRKQWRVAPNPRF